MIIGATGFSLADRGHWYFDFYKGQKHYCGPVRKSDGEQNAYISIKYSSDNIFREGQYVLGVRVRQLNGVAATNYHTYKTYANSQRMRYITTGYANWQYNLHGQVDSTSSGSRIKVWGYWNP